MSEVYDTNVTAFHTAISQYNAKLIELLQSANYADVAANAEKLEGLTLEQIMEMVSTTTGLTVAEIQSQLDDLIDELQDVPRDLADETTALDENNNAAIMTPSSFWTALAHFWEQQVGSAPETLNEIHELAAAIEENQDFISAIQEHIATKATKAELTSEAERLEGLITDAQSAATTEAATQTEVDEGVVDDKYVAPNTLKVRMDAQRTEMEADVNSALVGMAQAFTDALDELNAIDTGDGTED